MMLKENFKHKIIEKNHVTDVIICSRKLIDDWIEIKNEPNFDPYHLDNRSK